MPELRNSFGEEDAPIHWLGARCHGARAPGEGRFSVLILGLSLSSSASGASVVAIDNKIEQAMVSCSSAPSSPHLPPSPRGCCARG